jgi:tetratricopeptide (TPR) repeat protein
VKENITSDLIVCKASIKGTQIAFLNCISNNPEVGQEIIVIGAPKGLERTVSNGIVSSIRKDQDYGTLIQITAPISSGSSGSPVVDFNGNVLGVATFNLKDGQNLNFAIAISQILNVPDGEVITYKNWEAFNNRDKKNSHDFIRQGKQNFDEGKYDEAIVYFKKAIKIDNEFSEAYGMLGHAYFSLLDWKNASYYYDRAIYYDKNNATFYHGRSSCRSRMGNFEGALEAINIAINIEPLNTGLIAARGSIRSELADYDRAIEDYTIALNLDPTLIYLYHSRGLAKYFKNDFTSAEKDFTKAIERFEEKDKNGPYAYRGRCKEGMGDNIGAMEDYEKSIDIDPYWFVPYNFIGNLSIKMKEYVKAISYYTISININPDFSDSYFNRSIAKAKLGDYRGAIMDLNKDIELAPSASSYLNRGQYKIIIGYNEEGCLDLSKAGELGEMKAYEMIQEYCK